VTLEDLNDSWLFQHKLELCKETKKICTGITTFDINNLVLNEIVSKKLFNLSKSDPCFFQKLHSILTLQLFQRESSIINSSACLTILKKTGDLYYLFYKCLYFNEFELLEQWKQFLTMMRQNSSEKYDFFEEINKLNLMSLEEICRHPDVINRILAKKTKKILFLYMQNHVFEAFEKIQNFGSLCIKESPFLEYLMELIIGNEGKVLEKYCKILKKETNELVFLKTSIMILKILYSFLSKDYYNLRNFKSFAFSINLFFWKIAKMILFFHNGSLSLVLINFILFVFENLFIKNKSFKDEHSQNYLFLVASFLVVFQRNFSSSSDKIIILEAKKKILLIIEKILQIIENPIDFLKKNYYLEPVLDTVNLNNLFDKARSLESKIKNTPLKIDVLLNIINENKHFPEKIIIILHFLKHYLQRIYLDAQCFTVEFKKTIFYTLMKVSNAKDFKRLSLKERFANNNLLHQEKTILLIECFGIIGAFPQSSLAIGNIQNEDFCFDKSLTPMELSRKILVF